MLSYIRTLVYFLWEIDQTFTVPEISAVLVKVHLTVTDLFASFHFADKIESILFAS